MLNIIGIIDQDNGTLSLSSDGYSKIKIPEGERLRAGDLCYLGKNGKTYRAYSVRSGVYYYKKPSLIIRIFNFITGGFHARSSS